MIKAMWDEMISRENDVTESKTLCQPQPDTPKRMTEDWRASVGKTTASQAVAGWVCCFHSWDRALCRGRRADSKPCVAQRRGLMGRESERTGHTMETGTQDVVRQENGATSGRWPGPGDGPVTNRSVLLV